MEVLNMPTDSTPDFPNHDGRIPRPPVPSPTRGAPPKFPVIGNTVAVGGGKTPASPTPTGSYGDNSELPRLVDLNPHAPDGPSSKKYVSPKVKYMFQSSRSRASSEDDKPKAFNTEPLPYQSQSFKSSTVLKRVPIPKRHGEMWCSTPDLTLASAKGKGIILHTDRYQWDDFRPNEGYIRIDVQKAREENLRNFHEIQYWMRLSQRDRLAAERSYMERMRGMKRKREVIPHRAPMDLLMGGQKVSMAERLDITSELQRLKSIVLPTRAKDLYVGRGFKLPTSHAVNKPRGKRKSLDFVTLSAPATMENESQRLPPIVHHTRSKKKHALGSKVRKQSQPNGPPVPVDRNPSLIVKNVSKPPPMPKSEEYYRLMGASMNKDGTWSNNTQSAPERLSRLGSDSAYVGDTDGETRPESEMDIPMPSEIRAQPLADADTHPKTPDQSDTPLKAPTPNPLRGADVKSMMDPEQMEELRKTFRRLDTDMDGHIMFHQLKHQLPKDFLQSQERFIKQVYDITSASTFFGLNEFVTLSCLCEKIANLSGAAKEAYEKLDFATVEESIVKYVELFQSVDRKQSGKISIDALKEILSTTVDKDLKSKDEVFQEIMDAISPEGSALGEVEKMDYLAYIPYFLSKEPH